MDNPLIVFVLMVVAALCSQVIWSVRWRAINSVRRKWRKIRKKAVRDKPEKFNFRDECWVQERNAAGEKVWTREDNPDIEIVYRDNKFWLDFVGNPVFSFDNFPEALTKAKDPNWRAN